MILPAQPFDDAAIREMLDSCEGTNTRQECTRKGMYDDQCLDNGRSGCRREVLGVTDTTIVVDRIMNGGGSVRWEVVSE